MIDADGGLSGAALMLGASIFILELGVLALIAMRFDAWQRRRNAKKDAMRLAARQAAEAPLAAIAAMLREIETGTLEVIHSEHAPVAVDGEVEIAFKFRLKPLGVALGSEAARKRWFGASARA